ncbi:MAG TPA: polyisoprenoid-binding protein [Actinobacteria bacterium]|nr:polyisoprenoid-binding protein [Actinomycetota bacterium]
MTDLSATTGTWAIDPSHTTIGFSARHAMVAKVRGNFTEFTGSFTLDGEVPQNSSAELLVQTASLTTQNEDRDAHLKSADFLNVETNPTLTFKSTGVNVKGGDTFVVTGDLTIGGITKSVDVDFELVGVSQDPWGGTRIGFDGETEITRKDFGLVWNVALEAGGVLVGEKVKLTLDVEAVKQ